MTADTYADWNAVLAQARLGITPVGLHGSVAGPPCAGRAGVAELRVAFAPAGNP